MNLQRARDEKAKILSRMKEIQGEEALTDELNAEFSDLEKKCAEVNEDIRRGELLQKEEVAMEAVDRGSRQTAVLDPEAGIEEAIEDPKPFRSFGEQLVAVREACRSNGRVHDGLVQIGAAATGSNELVDSEGGYRIQSDFAYEIFNKIFDTGLISSRCRKQEVGPNANGLRYKKIKETSRANGYRYGGIQVYWEGEADQITSSKPKWGEDELKLLKLTGLYYTTDELLQDAIGLQSEIFTWFPEEFAFKVDDGIYNGTGVGMPLGVLNAGCKVQVAKETGQAASTVVAQNIFKMFARMPAKMLLNAVWIINVACWPQIFQLYQQVGTGGIPLFIPSGGINQSPFGTLLGRPILPIEQAAALGTAGDITFCDFNQYRLINKGGLQTASSIHVRFDYGETAFRFILRINGQPLWSSAVTPYKGSDTVSPFITLATRG